MRLSIALTLIPAVAAAEPFPQFPRMPVPPVSAVAAVEEPAPVVVARAAPVEDQREYGERFVREVGASFGFMVAPRFHSVTVAPSFGYFIADRVQLSAIASLTSIRAGADTSAIGTLTLEPSYHHPVDPRMQLVFGFGFGYSYIRELGHGMTYTGRTGAQFLLGRRGVFTTSVSYDFRSNENDQMESLASVASEAALRINLGYTAMF